MADFATTIDSSLSKACSIRTKLFVWKEALARWL
jgi:hypothetical protein